MGMILQTPRRTKEPYRLRKPRRSSATAQPTQQQAEKRGFARLTWEQPNNELYPGPCGRRHFRGKTRFTPVLCQKPFITNEGGCARMSRKMELFAARLPYKARSIRLASTPIFRMSPPKRGLSRSSLFRF